MVEHPAEPGIRLAWYAYDGGDQGRNKDHWSRGIFLQTMTVCPVLESIRVVTGSHRQDTVFAFSCLLTTQCSMTSAVGGGIWLFTGAGAGAGAARAGGAGVAATGGFLPGHPIRNTNRISHKFFMDECFQYNAAIAAEP
jgi:hypothetical protein